ncbi:MAG: sporulation protein YabP [Eubacteriales bacterium]|nr:sporulation protein YabP [Eubacteriales bacterium]
MERESKNESKAMPHGLTMQDRQRLTLSGVSDVVNFDENQVVVLTTLGTLTIRGTGLHVDQLSLDTGDLKLTGSVDSLEYDDNAVHGGGFFRRMFQ